LKILPGTQVLVIFAGPTQAAEVGGAQ